MTTPKTESRRTTAPNRITLAARDQMIARAQELAGISAARAQLRERQIAHGRAVLVEMAGGPEAYRQLDHLQRKLDALLSEVPKEFYIPLSVARSTVNTKVRVNLGGRAVCVRINDDEVDFARSPLWLVNDPDERAIPAGHPLVAAFFEMASEESRIDGKALEISTAVNSAILATNWSRHKLLKMWPEAKELMSDTTAEPCTAMTVPVESINKLIGLPTDTKDAA